MEFNLRPLKETDIPDVLEISKTTWDGHDHLPKMIDKWFSESEQHPFGIEMESHIVSIGNLHIIDEGKTGWMEGLRVLEKFRKQGLAKIMTDHLVKVAQERNIPRIRFVTASVSEAPIKLAQSIDMKEITRFGLFWKEHLDQIDWSHNSISFSETSAADFSKALIDCSPMIPENALICHWDVYDATEANVKEIGKQASFWIGTEKEEIQSLSLGIMLEAQHGKEWCFSIYANDLDSFKSTLSFHLNLAREYDCFSIVCIRGNQFKNLDEEIEWLKTIDFGFDLILFERRL